MRSSWIPIIVAVSLTGCAGATAGGTSVATANPSASCHVRGRGLFVLPDPRCTPGATNPAVTPATVGRTICRAGWTKTIRPPESVTRPEKLASMRAYGDTGSSRRYEYDHLVSLELGGAPNSTANLWPEPDSSAGGYYLNPKDKLENRLRRLVCDGRMGLRAAQTEIARNWITLYRALGVS